MTVFEYLKKRGFHQIYESFYIHINEWMDWYGGTVANFHKYKVYNGCQSVKCRRATLGIAKKSMRGLGEYAHERAG